MAKKRHKAMVGFTRPHYEAFERLFEGGLPTAEERTLLGELYAAMRGSLAAWESRWLPRRPAAEERPLSELRERMAAAPAPRPPEVWAAEDIQHELIAEQERLADLIERLGLLRNDIIARAAGA